MFDVTEPLKNGDRLPDHPEGTTAKRITNYGEVKDAHDGQILTSGLHANEIYVLMSGQTPALGHLYRFVIRQIGKDKRIFHTRPRVVISVETEDVSE